jgi:hypothetical protein
MIQLQIEIIGWLLMLLALIHIIFPRYFKWKTELSSLSLINREMMKVHTFFIALTVFGMGLLCISSAEELLTTPLGKKLLWGLAVFWSIRMLMQFFVYSSKLWKGKTFETAVHILFSCFWVYMSVVFWMAYLLVNPG